MNRWWCGIAGLIALTVWAWGTGENGDLPFALAAGGLWGACFAVGWVVNRWLAVVMFSAAWLGGWFWLGGQLDPDGYTWSVAMAAPAVALCLALGLGARRAVRPKRF